MNQSLSEVMQNQSNSLISLDSQLQTALTYSFMYFCYGTLQPLLFVTSNKMIDSHQDFMF